MEDCREESYLRRQEDELKVLESMFNDDFEDVRKKDKWKIPRPPEILLHLTPLESMSGNKDVHASATLRAKFNKNYPDTAPEIKLENAKGMSDEVIKDLVSELKRAAEQAVGEVMMLDLSNIVQENLHKYNRPALSIYEENKKFKDEQRAKEKKKLEELKKRKQDYQRREIEEEINRRKEEEKNIRKDLSRKRNKSDEGREHLDSTGSTGYDISQSPDIPVTELEFNTKSQHFVYKGKCIDKESSGCMVFIAIDKETGSPLAIHEWIIQCVNLGFYSTELQPTHTVAHQRLTTNTAVVPQT